MDRQWQAKWIMDPKFEGLETIDVFHKEIDKKELPEHSEDLKNRHMLVRKKFNITDSIENIMMNITADDYYKLYINGQFVGQGPAPAYHTHYNYNQYDISQYLKQGDNVIAVHVYYQGLVNRVWNSGDYRQGMIAEIVSDNKILLATDKTWKYKITDAYCSGGITGYDTQYLENIDSRLWEPNWRELDYCDDDWEGVYEHLTHDYQLQRQMSDNLSVYSIKPKTVKQLAEGQYLIDFGQEITGQFKMTASGEAGQVIEIRCGEELDEKDPNHVRYDMRCNCLYQEFWTLSGQKDVLELYDYKAFRYVEVIGPESAMSVDSFSAVVRHYPFNDNNYIFESSNELVDQVIKICKNGVKYGAQEVYVDCPTREKGQYLGDFTITGQSHIYLTGDATLYKKGLKDFALSTVICPGMMAIAPGARMQEIADFSLQWPMQVLTYYKHTGDKDFLKEMYPIIENLEGYFEKYKRPDGLIQNVDEKWNLVDWPDNLRDNYEFELTKPIGDGCHNVINAYYYCMLSYSEQIRDVLGIDRIHDLEGFKNAYVKTFYHKETQLFVDAENATHSAIQSNALPLLFDLFPDDNLKAVTELIKERAPKCGVYMAYFVLKSLTKVGEYELVYELINQLWSTMVEEDATTCFEAWGKDQKFNTSLCHPWASAPITVMAEDIMGLNAATPGWETIKFTPHIPESLKEFKFEVSVKTGNIVVEKKNGQVQITGPKGIEIER